MKNAKQVEVGEWYYDLWLAVRNRHIYNLWLAVVAIFYSVTWLIQLFVTNAAAVQDTSVLLAICSFAFIVILVASLIPGVVIYGKLAELRKGKVVLVSKDGGVFTPGVAYSPEVCRKVVKQLFSDHLGLSDVVYEYIGEQLAHFIVIKKPRFFWFFDDEAYGVFSLLDSLHLMKDATKPSDREE